MRVLFANNSAALTGAAISCATTIIGLRDRGRIDPVFAAPEDGPLMDRLRAAGVPCHVLPHKGTLGLGYVREFRRIMRAHRIEAAHLNTLTPFCKYAAIAARAGGVPVVWFVRENPLISRSRRLGRWLLLLARRIVFVDRATREALLPRRGDGRVEVIYNGVDLEAFRPARNSYLRDRFALADDAPIVGYVGLFTERKGVIDLIEAWPRVKETHPAARLALIGGARAGDEPYEAKMRARIAALGIGGEVLFTGLMEDVRPALGGLDALVLPSYEERCSRTLIEGLAMAIPIVATRVGGTPEVVEDGASGILVPPRDPMRLGEAVSLLLGDAALRGRMGRQGRARAEKRFDLAANLDLIAALYDGLRRGAGG